MLTALAESSRQRLPLIMAWDSATSVGMDIAAKITDLQKEELEKFFRDHLKRRDLHQVVANLNETALAKDNPGSSAARDALRKLGFAD